MKTLAVVAESCSVDLADAGLCLVVLLGFGQRLVLHLLEGLLSLLVGY